MTGLQQMAIEKIQKLYDDDGNMVDALPLEEVYSLIEKNRNEVFEDFFLLLKNESECVENIDFKDFISKLDSKVKRKHLEGII